MAVLVISANFRGGTENRMKRPGLRLAESLMENGVFSLLDVPSNFYLSGFNGKVKVLRLYFWAMIELCGRGREEVFFYNCPPAYLPLYLVALLRRLRRPSLLLADGINCVGLKHGAGGFFKFFRRIVSLPTNESIRSNFAPPFRFIWFPGIAQSWDGARLDRSPLLEKITLLYNSSLLAHNAPELALSLAARNQWLEVVVTDTEENFRAYISSTRHGTDPFPQNMKFEGVLTASAYDELLGKVDGLLLCRDESVIWNKYNFPSKLIEAMERGLPTVSAFTISGVSGHLYFLLDSESGGDFEVRAYLERWNRGTYEIERRQFLLVCDASRLREWVLGEQAA